MDRGIKPWLRAMVAFGNRESILRPADLRTRPLSCSFTPRLSQFWLDARVYSGKRLLSEVEPSQKMAKSKLAQLG